MSSYLFIASVAPTISNSSSAGNQTLYTSTNAYGTTTTIGYISSFQFTLSSSTFAGNVLGNAILANIQSYCRTNLNTIASISWESVMTTLQTYFLIVPIYTTLSLSPDISVIDLQYNIGNGAGDQVFANLTAGIPFGAGTSENSPGEVPQFLVSYNPILQSYIVTGTTSTYSLKVGSLLPFSFTYTLVQGAGLQGYNTKSPGYTYRLSITSKYCPQCSPLIHECEDLNQIALPCVNSSYTVNLPSPTLKMPILFQNQSFSSDAGVILYDFNLQTQALYNQFTVNKCTKKVSKYTKIGYEESSPFVRHVYTNVNPMAVKLKPQYEQGCGKQICLVEDCQSIQTLISAGSAGKFTMLFPGLTTVGNTVARNNKRLTANVYQQLANPAQQLATLTPNKYHPNNFQRGFLQAKTTPDAVKTCSFNGTFNQASQPFCGAVSVSFDPQNYTSEYNTGFLIFFNSIPVLIPCPYAPMSSCPIVGTLNPFDQPASYNIITSSGEAWYVSGGTLTISTSTSSPSYFAPTYTTPASSLSGAGFNILVENAGDYYYVYYDSATSAYGVTTAQASRFLCAVAPGQYLDFSNLQTSLQVDSALLGVGYALYDATNDKYVTVSGTSLTPTNNFSQEWYFTPNVGASIEANTVTAISITSVTSSQQSSSDDWTYTYNESTNSGVIDISSVTVTNDNPPLYTWTITLPDADSDVTVTVQWTGDYQLVNLFEFSVAGTTTSVSNLFSFYNQGITATWSTSREEWVFTYVPPTYS